MVKIPALQGLTATLYIQVKSVLLTAICLSTQEKPFSLRDNQMTL